MKNHKTLIIIQLIYLISSCQSTSSKIVIHEQLKVFDFKAFYLIAPDEWIILKKNGIDSYVGGLITNKKDTLLFDYGPNADSLDEPMPKIMLSKLKKYIDSVHLSIDNHVIFSDNPGIDYKRNKFTRQYYLYDTVKGRESKFVLPKKIGQGITGVVFGNLVDKNIFSFYGKNLDTCMYFKVLKVFRTIQFR